MSKKTMQPPLYLLSCVLTLSPMIPDESKNVETQKNVQSYYK